MQHTGLGIYILGETARWVLAELTSDGRPRIRAAGSFPLGTGKPAGLPSSLPDDITVCFGPDECYFYELAFPFSQRSKVLAVLKNDIEDRALDPVDTLVADFLPVCTAADGSVTGYGITLPKARVAAAVDAAGTDHPAAIVTIDLFAVARLLTASGVRKGTWGLISFSAATACMGRIEDGRFTVLRSIPAVIDSPDAAAAAQAELLRRMGDGLPLEAVTVMSGDPAVAAMLAGAEAFAGRLAAVPMEGEPATDALVPAAVALAGLDRRGLPDLRQEELAFPGVLPALNRHVIAVAVVLAVFMGLVIAGLQVTRSGYEQELRSLEARTSREAGLVIDADTLKKELVKCDGDLGRAVKNLAAKVRGGGRKGETDLPPSSFRILNRAFEFLPAELDVVWERITISARSFSMNGRFAGTAEDVKAFDTFVSGLLGSGDFEVKNKSAAGGQLRLTLEFLK